MNKEGWIEWSGGECPVGSNVPVEYIYRSGFQSGCSASLADWKHSDSDPGNDIVRYRVLVPQVECDKLQAEVTALRLERDMRKMAEARNAELLARISVAGEVQIISANYDRIREDQLFVADDLEYDLFAAGWKAAIANVKGGAA